MTRDYKNVPRSSDKPKKRNPVKKGVAKKIRGTPPGWLWLLAGLGIGLAVAAGVYIYDHSDMATAAKAPAKSEKPKPAAKPLPDVVDKSEPRFDFYTLLPKLEVIIPESEIQEEQQKLQPKEKSAYMIQVGSFRKYGEADSLKAKLAMLGIEADIEPVSSQGEQWLRVRVGPFNNTRELNKIRNRLHSNDFNTMLIKIKPE